MNNAKNSKSKMSYIMTLKTRSSILQILLESILLLLVNYKNVSKSVRTHSSPSTNWIHIF